VNSGSRRKRPKEGGRKSYIFIDTKGIRVV
jgi:hypothetical protein